MSDWSYLHQYVKLRGKRADELPELQERGADGWELVSAVPLGKRARRSAKADVLLLFKRQQPANGGQLPENSDDPSMGNGSGDSAPTAEGGPV